MMQRSNLGFNGQRQDPISGVYHLGNGYRAYNPTLMRFNCPDSMSPFGAGGINPYAYCVGDPINLTDPSGHISGQAIAGLVLGAIGIGLAAWTMGSSIAAAGGIVAAMNATTITALVMGTAGVAADVVGIVSDSMESHDPQLSATLGWVSMGLGGASMFMRLGGLAARAGPASISKGQQLARAYSKGLSGRGAMQAGRVMPAGARNFPLNHIDFHMGETYSTSQTALDFIWVPNFSASHGVEISSVTPGSVANVLSANSFLAVHATDVGQAGELLVGFHSRATRVPVETFAESFSRDVVGFRNSIGNADNVCLLGACYAAQEAGGISVAQRFADAAQVNVVATTGEIYIGTVGGNMIISKVVSTTGEFRFFRPVVHI